MRLFFDKVRSYHNYYIISENSRPYFDQDLIYAQRLKYEV